MQKFIILTRERTGSNLLVNILNKHPNIYCRGEVFKYFEQRKTTIGEEIHSVFEQTLPKEIKARGAKVFYYHVNPQGAPPPAGNRLWDYIKENTSVIHLKREDKIKMRVSALIAENSRYTAFQSKDLLKTEDKRIYIDPLDLENFIRKTKKMEEWGDTLTPQIEVTYEDLVNDPKKRERVYNFLGVDYREFESDYIKQNPERPAELIKNIEEVREHFKGTKWEKYLH